MGRGPLGPSGLVLFGRGLYRCSVRLNKILVLLYTAVVLGLCSIATRTRSSAQGCFLVASSIRRRASISAEGGWWLLDWPHTY
jgi:hypothetical protein